MFNSENLYKIGKPTEVLSRYVWAVPFCYDKDVLDVGCTYGTGAAYVARFAKSVTAVDSRDEFDSRNFKALVNFTHMDFSEELPTGKFDTILCIESYQRINRPDKLMENIAESLTPGGTLIFTVPAADRSIDMERKTQLTKVFSFDDVKKIVSTKLFSDIKIFDYMGISWVAIASVK
jgi:SAM-dependent methyltransferase